jgi:hypothetical protein
VKAVSAEEAIAMIPNGATGKAAVVAEIGASEWEIARSFAEAEDVPPDSLAANCHMMIEIERAQRAARMADLIALNYRWGFPLYTAPCRESIIAGALANFRFGAHPGL